MARKLISDARGKSPTNSTKYAREVDAWVIQVLHGERWLRFCQLPEYAQGPFSDDSLRNALDCLSGKHQLVCVVSLIASLHEDWCRWREFLHSRGVEDEELTMRLKNFATREIIPAEALGLLSGSRS